MLQFTENNIFAVSNQLPRTVVGSTWFFRGIWIPRPVFLSIVWILFERLLVSLTNRLNNPHRELFVVRWKCSNTTQYKFRQKKSKLMDSLLDIILIPTSKFRNWTFYLDSVLNWSIVDRSAIEVIIKWISFTIFDFVNYSSEQCSLFGFGFWALLARKVDEFENSKSKFIL